jgi:4'-phosphopantetheinyl transferase
VALNTWVSAPENIILVPNMVQVWRIPLDLPDSEMHALEKLLSDDELEKANRYRFQVHRNRYIVSRGALRKILGHYLGLSPGLLHFRYNSYGKPALDNAYKGEPLEFNISHSHELCLAAVTRAHPIGVDIEYIRSDLADEQIARRFFSQREVAMLLSLPEELRKEAFFNCWTRKEAFIKAIGEGLSMPLDRFDVSLTPGEQAVLLETRPDPAQVLHWNMCAFDVGQGYAAALVVRGQIESIQYWDWHTDSNELEDQ